MVSTLTPWISARAVLIGACFSVAAAQEKPTILQKPDIPKGQVAASVRSVAKPEQSYAFYVPENYTPEHPWPVIYAFDPSANGTRPVELIKEAAETYGYIVAASNNSRNGSWQIASDAAQAMWKDTHGWFSIDDKRIYFAGFSGGARVSAQLAQMCNCAHGVFLSGAGFPPSMPPTGKPLFAVFSTAGMSDFNYGELTELDRQLESLGVRHYLQRFDGEHSWAPSNLWKQALAWSALLEIKDNLREMDRTFVSAELARSSEGLRKREEAGEAYFAWTETRSTIATFDGLADISALKQRLDALDRNPAVRAGAKQEKADIETQHNLEGGILRIVQSLRDAGGDQGSMVADASNRIHGLVENSRREKRPEQRHILERALGNIFIFAMETGGPILEKGDARSAIPYFEIGATARPGWAWPHFALAKCHAITGEKKAVVRDLKNARDDGATSTEVADFVKRNPQLAFLVELPEYQKLLAASSPQASK